MLPPDRVAAGTDIGDDLSISDGSGDDEVTLTNGTSVGDQQKINLGSGANTQP